MITPILSTAAYLPRNPKSEIFNSVAFTSEPLLWIQIPIALAHLSICDVVSASGESVSWFRDGSESWFRIYTSELGSDIGFHKYSVQMIDPVTDWTTCCYFSYTIQNDDPDKPYCYMESVREESDD